MAARAGAALFHEALDLPLPLPPHVTLFPLPLQFQEKTTASSRPDDDKVRLMDMENALLSLQKTMQAYTKIYADFAACSSSFHEDLANVYPANAPSSSAVVHLNTQNKALREAALNHIEIRRQFERPLNELLLHVRDLISKAEERHVMRAEISHYREKVVRLANDGLGDTKAQQKAESNQEK